jgi:hypothetical protein
MKQHEAQDVGMVPVVLHGQTCHLHDRIGDEPTACGAETVSHTIEWWNRDEVRDEMLDRGLHPCRRQGCFGTNEHLLQEAAE